MIDADGFFHTGDQGVVDADGRLSFIGRLKDMLKVGGENVAAAEIEGFLAEHPAIAEVQVVAAPDERYQEVACAYVMLRPGAALELDEVIEHCHGQDRVVQDPALPADRRRVAHVGHEDPEVQAPRADRRGAGRGGRPLGAEAQRVATVNFGASAMPAASSSAVICSRRRNFWILVPDIGQSSVKRT